MTTERGSGTAGSGSTIVTTASDIVNVAAGDIEATDVQAAINELDTEKVAKAGDTMTGDLTVPNLVTSGNVDGRDVSADGAALDLQTTAINTSANAAAITIDASENVGIGSTNPVAINGGAATRLHVQGDIVTTGLPIEVGRFEGGSDSDGAAAVVRLGTSNDRGLYLEGGRDGVVAYGAIGTTDAAGTKVESIRLNSVGNVGIGVTPESWNSVFSAVQVGGLGSLFSTASQAAGGATDVGSNVYFDGSWKYIVTDEASRYRQDSGTHQFLVAASGTADTAITWTTALTIYNSTNATFGGDVSLLDNKHLYIGNSGDLDLYHDGNSRIYNNSGALIIKEAVNGNLIYFRVNDSGGVERTPLTLGGSTGLDATFGGNIGINESSPDSPLHITTSDFDCAKFEGLRPTIFFYETDGSADENYQIRLDSGGLQFQTQNDAQGSANNTLILDASRNATFSGNVSLANSKLLYLGSSSQVSQYHDGSNHYITNTTGDTYFRVTGASQTTIFENDDSGGAKKTCIITGGSTPYVRLYYNNVERLKTTSTGIEMGTFSLTGASTGIQTRSTDALHRHSHTSTGTVALQNYYNPNGKVGQISINGTTTTYATTSDKRLKTSHGLLTNAADIVNSIGIHEYHFNSDESLTLHGVMAQDCYEVYPNAISKPEDEADNWGADYSKLVPIMLANIQDLNKQMEALKCQLN